MREGILIRKPLVALLLLAPVLAGCSGGSDIFSRDAEWFSRTGRLSIRNISIETPPLTPTKPVTAEDTVSAEGGCPGMGPAGPTNANALADGAAAAPPPQNVGSVALGHTECDVVRGIGSAPDNVDLSKNARGDRVAVITYTHGPRAGIYTFISGRLSSIDRIDVPAPPPKAGKPKAKKHAAAG